MNAHYREQLPPKRPMWRRFPGGTLKCAICGETYYVTTKQVVHAPYLWQYCSFRCFEVADLAGLTPDEY